jgi:hypothetical protein
MGYSRDDARFQADLDRYRTLLSAATPLSLVLRALPPHGDGPDDLAPKLAAARTGVDWVEYFVYGLMRLEAVDWFRLARYP